MPISDSDYTDLHVHSTFSLLDGTADPSQLLEATKKLGRTSMALTDHGSVDGWLRFQKAAQKHDIKPIFGCEFYMVEHFEERSTGRPRNLHLSVIAKNSQGAGKIIQALGYANMEGMGKHGYAARPFLPLDYPIAHGWPGDVIIMTGCASSPFWNVEGGQELLGYYVDAFKDDIYAETMPIHDWAEQARINKFAFDAVEKYGIKPVVTSDIHYVTPEDGEFHEVVLGIGQRYMTWNNPKRWKFETHCSYVHTVEGLQDSLFKMGWSPEMIRQSILNTREVAEKCFHKIDPLPIKLPPVLGPMSEEQERETFLQMVLDGLRKRGVADKEGYLERAAREFDVIAPKGFVRYMLMVWDVVKWAKDHGVLIGPARGSVGGSLVAFALGITDIDPIYHRLWFERFIDPDRTDMPDIDIDVEDRNRHLVEQYLKEKYGEYNVAHVSTFGSMLGKSAIKDVSRLFEVPLPEVQKMCNCIPKVHESDARAHLTIKDAVEQGDPYAKEFASKYPKIVQFGAQLEGQVRGCGIHAAGFIVSADDLRTSARTHLVHRRDKVTINWDKNDAEQMGFVKLDLLGISTLSAVSEAVRLIKEKRGITLDMMSLPLDDKKTYEMVARGDTMTCFQLGTPGISKYCSKLKPDNFEHLAAITALWRPGPITSGAADMYAKCKNGQEPVNYPSPAFREITEISYGQIIYQEQMAQMLMKLAGYTYAAADKVRKIVSKKGGVDAWDAEEPKFLEGCKKVGIIEAGPAHELWQSSKMFALYAFNRAHSVGYGLLAYWTAYLKANYPGEWFCAYLNYGSADKEDLKTGEINRDVALREAQRSGIDILPPDINNSEVVWGVEQNVRGKSVLRVGLKDVKFVGDNAIVEIQKLKSRVSRVETIESFIDQVDGRACNSRVIKALVYCGAFDSIMQPEERAHWIMQYDLMHDTVDRPQKRVELLLSPPPEGDLQEVIDRERKTYLKFDPLAIDGSNAAERMCKILGATLDWELDEPVLRRGEKTWLVTDAQSGLLPGATGVLGPVEADTDDLKQSITKCNKCELRSSCKRPMVFERGTLRIMIVSETPNFYEDKNGRALIGDTGNELWPRLEGVGLLRTDVHVTNVAKCAAPKKTKPTPDQIDGCTHLDEEIKRIKPICILALGNQALYYFTGKEKGIMDMSGRTEWVSKANAWVTYSISPSNLVYAQQDGEYEQRAGMLSAALTEFARCVAQFA